MELLASVHWVATEEGVPNDFESVVQAVHGWNDRKRRTMKPEHIQVAWTACATLDGWDRTGPADRVLRTELTKGPGHHRFGGPDG